MLGMYIGLVRGGFVFDVMNTVALSA